MEYKHRVLPQTPTGMETLEELGYVPPEQRKAVTEKKALERLDYIPTEPFKERKAESEKQALRKVRKVRKVRRRKGAQASPVATKGKASAQQPARTMQQQPRDRMGRFASFVAGTARGVVKTVKAADRTATKILQGVTNAQPTRKRGRR
jgi:hypothetical protein